MKRIRIAVQSVNEGRLRQRGDLAYRIRRTLGKRRLNPRSLWGVADVLRHLP